MTPNKVKSSVAYSPGLNNISPLLVRVDMCMKPTDYLETSNQK